MFVARGRDGAIRSCRPVCKEQRSLGATLGATQKPLLFKPGKATTGDSPICRPKNP